MCTQSTSGRLGRLLDELWAQQWGRFRTLRRGNTFRTDKNLELLCVFFVAGQEEDLVFFGKGSDGLDSGGAAGGVHIGEGVVEEEESVHAFEVELGER